MIRPLCIAIVLLLLIASSAQARKFKPSPAIPAAAAADGSFRERPRLRLTTVRLPPIGALITDVSAQPNQSAHITGYSVFLAQVDPAKKYLVSETKYLGDLKVDKNGNSHFRCRYRFRRNRFDFIAVMAEVSKERMWPAGSFVTEAFRFGGDPSGVAMLWGAWGRWK